MQPLDFYFDFASPYGYFMSEKIDGLAAAHGRTVTWRPVLLFAILRALGLPPPLGHPAKLAYMTADFARSARHLGVDYRLPRAFPALTQHAARAFYVLDDKAPAVSIPFAQTVLRGYFCNGQDISDLDVVVRMVCSHTDALGSASAVRDLVQGDAAKSLLQNAIAVAVDRKVFGSPFVFVEDEPFFGVDRLPQIAARLAASV